MRITLEPVDVDRDAALLHRWVTHEKAAFWGMTSATLAEVAQEYAALSTPAHQAWLGRVDGEPSFLAETYRPEQSPLAGLPELEKGDLGMHVLVAPASRPRSGFTRDVMRAVVEHCFRDAAVRRVVVEPDVRNDRIARLNAAAGFTVIREITLPDKVAALSVVTRDDFANSELGGNEWNI